MAIPAPLVLLNKLLNVHLSFIKRVVYKIVLINVTLLNKIIDLFYYI
jgi:hypothetical protein